MNTSLNVHEPIRSHIFSLMCMAALASSPAVHAAGETAAASGVQSTPVSVLKTEAAPPVSLVVNTSRILRLEIPATRISVANPAVADITPISSREIYVLGKSIGNTNLIIWNKSGATTSVDISVIAEPLPSGPAPEKKDSVEVIKGLQRIDVEFNKQPQGSQK